MALSTRCCISSISSLKSTPGIVVIDLSFVNRNLRKNPATNELRDGFISRAVILLLNLLANLNPEGWKP